ncbi:MAG: DUF484 family protein [Psychrobium sp.]|nr:DUF484 family protein [Psychrobium sp.]
MNNELDELSQVLDQALIVEYLEQNPNFFQQQPQLLASLTLPSHEHGTVSLVQRQQTIMRDKITTLEDEITSLMGIATQNQQLYQQFTRLFFVLLDCHTLAKLEQQISDCFVRKLGLSEVKLKLFTDNAPASLRIKRSELDNLLVQRLDRNEHYFGRINQQEQHLLFEHELVGSVALIALGKHGELGLLAIASNDANHFHPEMDNLMLMQLCRLISSLINRLL